MVLIGELIGVVPLFIPSILDPQSAGRGERLATHMACGADRTSFSKLPKSVGCYAGHNLRISERSYSIAKPGRLARPLFGNRPFGGDDVA